MADRHPDHVPQHRCSRQSDRGHRYLLRALQRLAGQGPRPLIVYGPGTQGQGDQCAPSRQFNQGIHWSPYLDIAFNYEELFVSTMVARGFAIVMTDYEGLGTPGRAHLRQPARPGPRHARRGARRASSCRTRRWTPMGPMAFWGYSQGGGAAASAAELAPSVRTGAERRRHLCGRAAGRSQGTVALRRRQRVGRGRRLRAQLASSTAYPEAEAAIRSKLTPRGEDLLFKVRDQCIAETIAKFMFRHLQPYFNEDINELVQRGDRSSGLFDEQRIGTLQTQCAGADQQQPLRPVGAVDGGQPAGPRLVRTGCRRRVPHQRGAAVPQQAVVNHALPMLVDGERGHAVDRRPVQRVPTTPNCGQF